MRPGTTPWLAALALVAGCASHTPAARPTAPLSDTFSRSGTAALPDRWWLAIPDPALHRLVEAGLAGNLDLRAAWARLEQADAQLRGTHAASRPTLDASASGRASASGDGDSTATDRGASFGLAASYEVDLWGRVRAGRDAAVASTAATAHDVQAAAMTLSAEIASAWYALVAARAEDALLARQQISSQATLDLVTARVAAGLVASDDQTRQEQSVESLRASRALAAADIAVLEHRLAVLVGRAPTDAVAPASTALVALPALVATGVPSETLQRRPDVQAAFARVEAADFAVAEAVAARYPRLSISAQASIDAPFTGWLTSLVAGLAAPLYDGGARRAEVDRSRAALVEAILGYQQLVLDAATEVEDALVREARQGENVASIDRQLALSAKVLAAARQRYTAGVVDFLRVLEAEQTHQSLERQRLTAEQARIENRIALYRALAGEWGLTAPAKPAA
jgi:NodT family efflux transporter outer membrane factor (OMF) lipoprotein